jgi:hypothetical protein
MILTPCLSFLPRFTHITLKGVGLIMANKSESKDISVNTPVTLKGFVKAIFNDTIHVQIGGKIIPIPASELQLEK